MKKQLFPLVLVFFLMISSSVSAQEDLPWNIGDMITEKVTIESDWETIQEGGLMDTGESNSESKNQFEISEINETSKMITLDYLVGGDLMNFSSSYNATFFGVDLARNLIRGNFQIHNNMSYLTSVNLMRTPQLFLESEGLEDGFEETFEEDRVVNQVFDWSIFEFYNVTLGGLLSNFTWSINGASTMDEVDIDDDTRKFEVVISGGSSVYRQYTAENGSTVFVPYQIYQQSSTFEYNRNGRLKSVYYERLSRISFEGITDTSRTKLTFMYGSGTVSNALPGFQLYLTLFPLILAVIVRKSR